MEFGACRLYGFAHGNGFVGWQVIHHDDVSRRQGGQQDLLDIGQEGHAVHGSVQDHRCRHTLQPESPDEGGGLPVPVGYRGPASFPARRTTAQPGHLGRGAGLVDEHQAFGIEIRLKREPGAPPAQDVRTLLLAGVRGFF